jgi:hypothetical protein
MVMAACAGGMTDLRQARLENMHPLVAAVAVPRPAPDTSMRAERVGDRVRILHGVRIGSVPE